MTNSEITEFPSKILLTDTDGNRYIRYKKHKYATLIVKVIPFDDINILAHNVEQYGAWCHQNNMPFLGTQTQLGPDLYLLVAVEIDYITSEINERTVKKLAYGMRRLADWFFYNHLLPEYNAEN